MLCPLTYGKVLQSTVAFSKSKTTQSMTPFQMSEVLVVI